MFQISESKMCLYNSKNYKYYNNTTIFVNSDKKYQVLIVFRNENLKYY